MCPHHANKERDLMCSCGVPICYLCEKTKKHSGHTSIPLVDSIAQKVLELKGLTKELNDVSEKEAEAISKISSEQLSVPKVITDGCMSILADLQLVQSAVETRCKEINEMSQSLSDAMTHNLGIQCNSLEAVVKNHRALISKANQVAQQQPPADQQQHLEVLQAHSILSSFLLDKTLLLDTHRLEPCEQAKAVTCRSGPRDEVIGMIRVFGTVSKGRVPNTPSGGRAPMCTSFCFFITTSNRNRRKSGRDEKAIGGHGVLV
ncbi:hypothetical protein Pelo_19040 [Pelomyxa schiedti]|nr:hypothetical protein Pelo_19040 [Pelomyxa schiedti]